MILKKLLDINAFQNEVKMSLLKASFPGVKSLIIPTALILLQIGMLYYLNTIYGELYNAIQNYQEKAAWNAVAAFSGIAGLLVLVEALKTFEINKLQFTMRTCLLSFLLKNDYKDKTNSNFVLSQRIQEDSAKYTEVLVELSVAFFEALVRIPLFISVIMTLTSVWTGVIILISIVLGTILTKVVGKKLVIVRSEYETAEALFRNEINTEFTLKKYYELVKQTYSKYNEELKKLTFTVGGLNQVFVLLPFVVLMPLYFSKALTLGSFLQSSRALDKIIQSLSVIIDQRQNITKYYTAKKRLEELLK